MKTSKLTIKIKNINPRWVVYTVGVWTIGFALWQKMTTGVYPESLLALGTFYLVVGATKPPSFSVSKTGNGETK